MDQLHTYLRLASVPSPTWPALYELGNPQSKASLLGERIPEGGFVSREVVKRRVVYMSQLALCNCGSTFATIRGAGSISAKLQYLCLCSFNINVASGTVCSY
jgi:hypothetical protein